MQDSGIATMSVVGEGDRDVSLTPQVSRFQPGHRKTQSLGNNILQRSVFDLCCETIMSGNIVRGNMFTNAKVPFFQGSSEGPFPLCWFVSSQPYLMYAIHG